MPRVHDGAANPDPEHGPASGLRFAVVVSRFNDFVTSKLLDGCIEHLEENGADTDEIDIYWVPGAFEIPIAAQKCAQTGRFDAVICLGAVILGETDHYRLVVDGATQGIARVGLDTGVPVIFEVLATRTVALAMARAGGSAGNKGEEAAQAAIEIARLLQTIE
ncbi:MAG: 6,7-dimethyl-8-ribityllumazine synthase [Chloroflexi bacterium]|nr:6,7-dimethyl-8-ribityllumazine synthase [Chloroflexota bacterium]